MAATNEMSTHQPVLLQEIIHALQPSAGGRYVDGTIGAGGHARGILEACSPDGLLLGLDVDPQALALARELLAPYGRRLILAQASYASLREQIGAVDWDSIDGLLLDLGVSSMQLDTAGRGFSFRLDGPVNMRFDAGSRRTAASLLNERRESELVEILRVYGEEPQARRIAGAIVRGRPIRSTTQLADVILRATGNRGTRIHPATRTFQALRITVNDELRSLEKVLPQAVAALRTGGRLAIISYHSLEDRIVKDYVREMSKEVRNPPFEPIHMAERAPVLRNLTPKPIVPTTEENRLNPRARSAKLRIAEKL